MANQPPAGVAPPPGYHWDSDLQGYVGTYHDSYNHTSQVVWHPGDGAFDPQSFGTDRYTTVDGHKTLAGFWNDAGNFVPFTKTELADHVKKETETANKTADAAAKKAGFKNAADQKAAATKAANGTASGSYNPNANATPATQNNNPWDNLAAGTSGDYSKSKITTGYTGDTPGGYLLPTNAGTSQATLEDLLKNFSNSGPDEIKKVQQQLRDAGIGGSGSSAIQVTGIADTSTLVAYRGLLQNALLMQQNGQHITPDELLASLTKSVKSKTTTSTNVNLTNPVQARQALTTAFGDKLGRKPTDQEVLTFTSELNSYEKSNPNVSTTTTDASGQDVTNQTTTDKGTGSLNFVNDRALDTAQNDPRYAPEYHAAQVLDFYNLALQSLANSPVSTGNAD